MEVKSQVIHVILPTLVLFRILQEKKWNGGDYIFLVVEGAISRIKCLSPGASEGDDFELTPVIQFYLMTARKNRAESIGLLVDLKLWDFA